MMIFFWLLIGQNAQSATGGNGSCFNARRRGLWLEIADKEAKESRTEDGEDRHDQHAGLQPDLLGCHRKGLTPLGGKVAGRNSVGHDAQKLGRDGCAEVAPRGHERERGHAGIGHFFLHHDEGSGPQHGGAKTGEDAGDERGNDRGREAHDQVADGRADHAEEQDSDDVFAESGVGDAGQPQKDREHGNAQNITEGFVQPQRILHEARDPVAHGVLGAASKEDAAHAKRHAHRPPFGVPGADVPRRGVHIGEGGDQKQNRGEHGQCRQE